MYINKTDTPAHQFILFDKKKKFIYIYGWGQRKGLRQGQDFFSVIDVALGSNSVEIWVRNKQTNETWVPVYEHQGKIQKTQ